MEGLAPVDGARWGIVVGEVDPEGEMVACTCSVGAGSADAGDQRHMVAARHVAAPTRAAQLSQGARNGVVETCSVVEVRAWRELPVLRDPRKRGDCWAGEGRLMRDGEFLVTGSCRIQYRQMAWEALWKRVMGDSRLAEEALGPREDMVLLLRLR